MSTRWPGMRGVLLGAAMGALAVVGARQAPAETIDTTLGQGIGTSVPAVPIQTGIASVRYGDPVLVHRRGLGYHEVRGSIQGTGWGGQWFDLQSPGVVEDANAHYAYDVSFVLRWPSSWEGTLVYYGHGRTDLGLLVFADPFLGEANEGRRLEEEGDFVADAVLVPRRGHAYFSMNVNGLRPDGSFAVTLLEGPHAGDPAAATIDVPIVRDAVQVAARLLERLAGREPVRIIGTGHSAGALVMQYLDGGQSQSPETGLVVPTGGNHRTAYDPSSGTIFQGFVPLAGGSFLVDPTGPMSVPMLMIGGLAELSAVNMVQYAARLVTAGVDVNARFRAYQVRNLPHSWAEIAESAPNLTALVEALFGVTLHADGDRMQPVVAAVIDALVALLRSGTPPPVSRIDGVAVDTDGDGTPDAIEFPQAGGPPTRLVGSVWDPALDVYVGEQIELSAAGGFPGTTNRYRLALATLTHQPALTLPRVTCRQGGFRIDAAFSDSELIPLATSPFRNRGQYQACVSHAIHDLARQGLYDAALAR